MRAIDATLLESKINEFIADNVNDIKHQQHREGTKYAVKQIRKIIQDVPTLDVQPVIKCKDCRHAILTSDGMCKYCTSGIFVTELYVDGDFYCANAERKEKHNNEKTDN